MVNCIRDDEAPAPSRRSPGEAPARGRREQRKRVTRRELLTAGRRLFGEKGLYESRVEDLSRQAGIAKGTLYGYFANKEELIEAVVAGGFSELLGFAHREAQGARSHAEVVARLVRAHFAFFEENPDLMRVFHQVRGLLKFDRREGLALRRVLANYLAGLAHLLALHRPARGGGDAELLTTATLLFGAVSGISSMRASLAGSVPRLGPSPTIHALVALVTSFEEWSAPRPQAARARARAGAPRRGGRPAPAPRRAGAAYGTARARERRGP